MRKIYRRSLKMIVNFTIENTDFIQKKVKKLYYLNIFY